MGGRKELICLNNIEIIVLSKIVMCVSTYTEMYYAFTYKHESTGALAFAERSSAAEVDVMG